MDEVSTARPSAMSSEVGFFNGVIDTKGFDEDLKVDGVTVRCRKAPEWDSQLTRQALAHNLGRAGTPASLLDDLGKDLKSAFARHAQVTGEVPLPGSALLAKVVHAAKPNCPSTVSYRIVHL